MSRPSKLDKAKKVGLTVTDINPTENAKLNDFIEKTEGIAKEDTGVITEVYSELGVGRKPRDKRLAKRYVEARKRLKAKGLL